MTLVMAILPIALLVAVMTLTWPRRWLPLPAHVALPGVAVLAYALRFLQPVDTAHPLIHAAVVDGLLSSLTPLAIVFGAVLLFKTMDKSGATAVLSMRLRELTPDPIAQLMLVGWAFSFLIEGLSGFGTPAALAAPILAGLGFPALRVAAMCLIMNSVPVSFGAVGTPTWFGLGGVDLAAGELGEIGWRTALVHAAAAPFIALLALRVVAPWYTLSYDALPICYWRSRPLFAGWTDAALRLYTQSALETSTDGRGLVLRWSPEWEARCYALAYADGWPLLEALPSDMPVLVVRGAATDVFTDAAVAQLRAVRPQTALVTLDGGHLFPMTAPAETATVLLQWLAAQRV